MFFRDILKLFVVYMVISITFLLLNAIRCIRTNRIWLKYESNLQKGAKDSNKDYEYSIEFLTEKADLNYKNYVDNLLETLPKRQYFNQYSRLFEDTASRFRQKMKRFLLWPLIVSNYIWLHLFKKEVFHASIIFRLLAWFFPVVGEHYLIKFIESPNFKKTLHFMANFLGKLLSYISQ